MATKATRKRARVKVGTDAEGKPIYKWAAGYTKKELALNKEEIKRKYVGGVEVRKDAVFEVYLKEWYEVYKKPYIGASSQRNYNSIINKHILPAFQGRQLRAITAPELQAFINQFAGRGQTTITYIHAVLTGMFGEATAQNILEKDPALRLRKPEHSFRPRRALTDAETAAALSVGRTHQHGLLLLVYYYLGVRKGEGLGLRVSDINYQERTVTIQRDIDYVTNDVGELKTTESERELPIPNELYAALLPFRAMGDAYIFSLDNGTSFWSASTYNRYWRKLMAAMYALDHSIESETDGNGVTASTLTAHYFRHNYATFLYDAEVDVLTAQKYLGHADVQTTLNIYTELKSKREKKSAAKLKTAFDFVAELQGCKNDTLIPQNEKIISFAEMKRQKAH